MKNERRLRPYLLEPGVVRQLREEHREMERWFDFVVEEAHRGDWHSCHEAWHPFASLIERHMQFEERRLFPALARTGPDGARTVQELTRQHAEMRDRIFDLSLDIELHLANAERVEHMVELLRGHARYEDDRLYPWVEQSTQWMAAPAA